MLGIILLIATGFFTILTVVLIIVGIVAGSNTLNRISFIISAVGMLISWLSLVVSIGAGIVNPEEIFTNGRKEPLVHLGPSYEISSPTPTAAVEYPNDSGFILPDEPLSPYGKALQKNLNEGRAYSDYEKMDIILDTYETRKDKQGENEKWYYSVDTYDETTKHNMTIYYADDMPFFVNVLKNKEGVVKLYYWGDELLMCYDKRGADRVERYEGSEGFDALSEEFAHIYELACKLAKN